MHKVLADERIAPYGGLLGKNVVKRAAEEVFDRARASGAVAHGVILDQLAERLERLRQQELLTVINGTGIIINTNLGRAPLMYGQAGARSFIMSRASGHGEED